MILAFEDILFVFALLSILLGLFLFSRPETKRVGDHEVPVNRDKSYLTGFILFVIGTIILIFL
jgi:hypothetical protein